VATVTGFVNYTINKIISTVYVMSIIVISRYTNWAF
jgi:hypothetical protein